MLNYLKLIDKILHNGVKKTDRTGTGTLSLFSESIRYNLKKGFPLVSVKKTFYRGAFEEMLWFLRGESNIKSLTEREVHIWDEWANENGDLGRVYGVQWRSWINRNGEKIDQIDNIIKGLKNDPYSRRHIVVAYNPGELDEMALPPCHYAFQFVVGEKRNDANSGVITYDLNLSVDMRSTDVFLGLPFNIAGYALLCHIIAAKASNDFVVFSPNELEIRMADCHLYTNHLDQARTLLTRTSYPLPKISVSQEVRDKKWEKLRFEDFSIHGYESYEALRGKVSV